MNTGKNSFALEAKNNEDRLRYMANNYITWKSVFNEAFQDSEKSYKYVYGDSWDTTLKAQLIKAGLPVLDINIMLPRLLRILGQERKTRGKIRFVPYQQMDATSTNVANGVFDWVENTKGLNRHIAKMFADLLIGDLGGWGEWVWSTASNYMGEPVFRHINPFYIFRDPNYEFDDQFDKWRFVGKSYWEDLDVIIQQFPEKSDELMAVLQPISREVEFEDMYSQDHGLNGGYMENRDEFVWEKGRMFRMLEMQERVQTRALALINPANGKKVTVEMKDRDVIPHILSQQPHLVVVEENIDKIYTHTSVGDYVYLGSAENEVQNGRFSIIGMAGLTFNQKNQGLMRHLWGSQEGYQKTKSTILHIMHTMAASGWMYEDQSLSPEMEEVLRTNGAAAGLNIRYEKNSQKPEKIKPNIPANNEWMLADGYLRDATIISSVGDDQLGQQQFAGEAAALNEKKVQNAMLTLEPFFESLDEGKKQIGAFGWALARKKMKGPRLLSFVDDRGNGHSMMVNERVGDAIINPVDGDFHATIVLGSDTETHQREKIVEAKAAIEMMPPDLVYWPYIVENLEYIDPDTQSKWLNHIHTRMGPPPEELQNLVDGLPQLGNLPPILPPGGSANIPQQNI